MRAKQQPSAINRGVKLRNLRLFYGISQREFGEKLGVTRGAINSYEANQNNVPNNLILRVIQATGIPSEYFETDMALQEAIDKGNIKPIDVLKMNDFDETSCFVYEGIENYAKNNFATGDFSIKLQVLTFLFDIKDKANYHFIKLNECSNEPFAKNGDILIVTKTTEALNGDFVITKFQENYIIFQYFIAGINEVLLKGTNGVEIKLKNNELDKVEILGIIKQKITNSL